MSKPRKITVKARKKKIIPRRTTTPRRRKTKKTVSKTTPGWVKFLTVFFIVVIFFTAFYWFFVRPYSYRWKPCYGQEGYGVCLPNGYPVHGIDISHYQGNIVWEELALNRSGYSPLHFIFMKATEGGDLDDKTFGDNFELARKHGFIRGAYHFFIPRTDAIKQAEFFIRMVKLIPGDLPPVLDVEVTGNKNKQELQKSVKLWLQHIEKHYGVKPIIYASYKFKLDYLNDSVLNTYPYWIAHYYVDSVKYQGKWDFWQHSDRGKVSGIKENVDLNVFNGTLEELKKLVIAP